MINEGEIRTGQKENARYIREKNDRKKGQWERRNEQR
jgi:hypothetical protein